MTWIILFIVALFYCANIPLLHLFLAGVNEPLRRSQVRMAFLCAVIGVGLLTVLALDGGFYLSWEKKMGTALGQLGTNIASNFTNEVRQLHSQLKRIEAYDKTNAVASPFVTNLLADTNFIKKTNLTYPDFSIASKVGDDGCQIRRRIATVKPLERFSTTRSFGGFRRRSSGTGRRETGPTSELLSEDPLRPSKIN